MSDQHPLFGCVDRRFSVLSIRSSGRLPRIFFQDGMQLVIVNNDKQVKWNISYFENSAEYL